MEMCDVTGSLTHQLADMHRKEAQRRREWALACGLRHGSDNQMALENYLEKYPQGRAKRQSTIQFIRRQVDKFEKYGTVDILPGRGRPTKLPDSVLIECAKQLTNGYMTDDGQKMWYSSIRTACMENSVLREAVLTYNLKPRNLLVHIKRMCPNVVRRPLSIKPPLINKRQNCKERRLADSTILLKAPEHLFMRTFWLDAASLCVRPDGTMMVWTTREEQGLLRTDPHLALQNKNATWLKYYAVVNALEGPVALVFVTGTTGLPKTYKASADN